MEFKRQRDESKEKRNQEKGRERVVQKLRMVGKHINWHAIISSIPLNMETLLSDDIKEEEMEIEAFEYDNDDFENDPSFGISSDLEDQQLDEDELDDYADEESGLDELNDTPRKRRRKAQVPDNKAYK